MLNIKFTGFKNTGCAIIQFDGVQIIFTPDDFSFVFTSRGIIDIYAVSDCGRGDFLKLIGVDFQKFFEDRGWNGVEFAYPSLGGFFDGIVFHLGKTS